MRPALVRALVALALVPAADSAYAQAQIWPTRPVRLVLAFGAGGSVDVIARLLSGKIGESMGQSLLVENKPGADGDLAGETVARSAPDGYTLLLTSQAVAVNVSLRPKRAYKIDELAPVMLLAETQAVLAVPSTFAAKTVKDVIELAKAQPGKYDYGSTGIGTSGHMAMELFRISAGIDVVHVPFRNIGQWMTDLVAGRISLGMPTIPAASGHIKSGRLRALGASGTRRSAALPDVPTVAEAGVAGYSATTWYGVFAPRGTSATIVARVNGAFRAAIGEPANKARLAGLGVEAIGSSPAELEKHVGAEVKRWAEVIRKAGIKPD